MLRRLLVVWKFWCTLLLVIVRHSKDAVEEHAVGGNHSDSVTKLVSKETRALMCHLREKVATGGKRRHSVGGW